MKKPFVYKKVKAVSRVVSGEKIQPEDEGNWSSQSFYIYLEGKGTIYFKGSIRTSKRGPKFKHPQETPEENMEALKKEVDRLRDCLEEKERQIYLLKQKLEPRKNEIGSFF